MSLPPEVCIRGAGIVGRTLALLLARERVRVALVAPQLPNPHEDVRAYALNAASRTLLEELRAWPDAQHATQVREMQVNGDGGGRVQFSAPSQKVDALAWIVDVPALERQLSDAVRFQPRIDIVAEPVAAALTVVCEGKVSTTRDALGVRYEVTRYPQHAIAARLEAEQPHGEIARQWFDDRGEVLALLPVGGPGSRSLALVWSVDQLRAGVAGPERRRLRHGGARSQSRRVGCFDAHERACRLAPAARHRRSLERHDGRRQGMGAGG